MSISEKIVGLRIATRKAAMCENLTSAKNTLSLKTKILYLLRDDVLTPADIMDRLVIVKANLAHIATELISGELIVKRHNPADKREITYAITDLGLKHLQKRLEIIEQIAKKAFPASEEYTDAENQLENALNIFDFII